MSTSELITELKSEFRVLLRKKNLSITSSQKTPLIAHTSVIRHDLGNRCGHDKNNPALKPINYEIKSNLPLVTRKAIKFVEKYYWKPDEIDIFRETRLTPNRKKQSERRLRSELREAICRVVSLIFANTDLASLRVGNPIYAKKRFYLISVEWIIEKTGLSKDRVYRALQALKLAGFLKTKKRFKTEGEGTLKLKFKGRTAVRIATTSLFTNFGVTLKELRKAAKDAYLRKITKLTSLGIPTAAAHDLQYFSKKVKNYKPRKAPVYLNNQFFSRNETEILRGRWEILNNLYNEGITGQALLDQTLQRLLQRFLD